MNIFQLSDQVNLALRRGGSDDAYSFLQETVKKDAKGRWFGLKAYLSNTNPTGLQTNSADLSLLQHQNLVREANKHIELHCPGKALLEVPANISGFKTLYNLKSLLVLVVATVVAFGISKAAGNTQQA